MLIRALRTHPLPRRTRGFTLIEVMIALLVFGVGLFALAGLQSQSLMANERSYLRSQAVIYAQEMGDRMRANPRAVRNGAYNSGNPGATAGAVGTLNGACNSAAGCDKADMATNDLAEWSNSVQQLPAGAGVVCVDSTPDDGNPGNPLCDGVDLGGGGPQMHAIKVFWQRNGNQRRFTTQVRPLGISN